MLFSINRLFSREQVSCQFGAQFAFRIEFVSENHDQIQNNSGITREEIDIIELLPHFAAFVVDKHFESAEKSNYDAEYQSEISSRETQRGRERQFMILNVLSLTCFDKTNVRHQNGDPSQKAENDDEIEDVFENCSPFVDHMKKCNARDRRQ